MATGSPTIMLHFLSIEPLFTLFRFDFRYVYICQEFIVQNSLPPDQFAEDALPQLLYLCWDRVPNVRIAIARCLAAVIWPLGRFLLSPCNWIYYF